MIFGYARVSTGDQHLDVQTSKLTEAGAERIFCEVASGAKADRPELEKLIAQLREGDVVIVVALDRLGRNLTHLLELVDRFKGLGVDFRSLREGMDTSTSMGRLIFQVFGALAEFEREVIRERTHKGLEAARARGKRGGRRPKMTATKLEVARQMLVDGSSYPVVAETIGVSVATVYRLIPRKSMEIPND